MREHGRKQRRPVHCPLYMGPARLSMTSEALFIFGSAGQGLPASYSAEVPPDTTHAGVMSAKFKSEIVNSL